MKVTSSTGEEIQMVLAENANTGRGKSFLPETAQKYGTRFVTVTQTLPDMERIEAYRRKTAAFEEWRQKLNRSDRLPRGSFFKGKKAGVAFFFMDEFWQASADKPYDLSQMDPFRPAYFGPSTPKVTVESLARFRVMEGIETPSPGARAFLASIEAQTNKPE